MGNTNSKKRIISKEEFLAIKDNRDFLRARSNYKSFVKKDEGNSYVFTGKPTTEGSLVLFPVFNKSIELFVTVSQYKLASLLEEGSKQSWVDRVLQGKVDIEIKLKTFTPSKSDAGKYIFPKFFYDVELVAKNYNATVEHIEELMFGDYDEMSALDKRHKIALMQWIRRQPYTDVISEHLLKADGQPTARLMESVNGTMTYQALHTEDYTK